MAARKHEQKKPPLQVFISYVPEDADLARRLAEALREAGYQPWYAEESVSPGENWALRIGQAILGSDVIVALLSPSTFRSPWARREWDFALGSERHAGRVIPVLTPGTSLDTVPWILKHLKHIRSGPDWRKTTREVVGQMRHLEGAA